MKYIITEEQYKRINEITVWKGSMSVGETYKDILDIIHDQISDKLYYKSIKKYLKDVLGYPEKLNKNSLIDYGDSVTTDYFRDDTKKELMKPDVLANLSYHMAKKFLKVERLGTLECYIKREDYGSTYYFFDPELEICVGYISVKREFGRYYGISLPSDSAAVTTSQVDKGLRGTGVGKQMYLAILDDVDVLLSDQYLYTDSLNIWVNVLPKYVYVGALYYDTKPKRVTSKTPILKHEDVSRYFATKNPNLIKGGVKK